MAAENIVQEVKTKRITQLHYILSSALYGWDIVMEQYFIAFRAGEHDYRTMEGSEQDSNLQRIFIHPNYDPKRVNNDIALFKLKTHMWFNTYVKPVCLPTKDLPAGTKCYATGMFIANFTIYPQTQH